MDSHMSVELTDHVEVVKSADLSPPHPTRTVSR
jgi:hypothetical protein